MQVLLSLPNLAVVQISTGYEEKLSAASLLTGSYSSCSLSVLCFMHFRMLPVPLPVFNVYLGKRHGGSLLTYDS